jgi:hypothetical protein
VIDSELRDSQRAAARRRQGLIATARPCAIAVPAVRLLLRTMLKRERQSPCRSARDRHPWQECGAYSGQRHGIKFDR